MTSGAPDASVIVCTRDRRELLGACVRSVISASRACPGLEVELVVVDNGSRDQTPKYLERLLREAPLRVQAVAEPRIGLSHARNAGMKAALGEVLVFIDDDCTLDPQYFHDLRAHYAERRSATILGGRVELGDPQDLPLTIKVAPEREHFAPPMHPGGFVQGCNMTMNRETARRVGEFDGRFGAGAPFKAAEDTDYLLRAYNAGVEIEYRPDMVVYHHHGRRDRSAIRRTHHNYNYGNGALYLKHRADAPWLLKHVYWTLAGALRESVGGPPFDPVLRLSHWPVLMSNLRGALRYGRIAVMDGVRARAR